MFLAVLNPSVYLAVLNPSVYPANVFLSWSLLFYLILFLADKKFFVEKPPVLDIKL